jgi:hypothetical protein
LGQLTYRESFSDTILCLKVNSSKLYHLGIGSAIVVSTIARANETSSNKIYTTLACQLIQEAKELYIVKPETDIVIQGSVFAIDAPSIEWSVTAFYGRHSDR